MTLFDRSQKGQKAWSLPKSDPCFEDFLPPEDHLRKESWDLAEVSELDLTRHFCALAKKNMGIDTHFYPLGSCTMKFNPRINEACAQMPHFTRTHPLAPDGLVQGNLRLIHHLLERLCEISGMAAGTLVPNAGAQGEFVGVRMIQAYHRERGDVQRTQMLIPDSAHGTNPATASMAGLETLSLKTQEDGDVDLQALRELSGAKTAGLMLTNPNTLGLFSSKIQEIARIVHESGGLVYYDGANLNPLLSLVKPGMMGFDVMHVNLHKTFSTPHGGGGPGSGPVLCSKALESYLPLPRVRKQGETYETVHEDPSSIGQVASFHGNFGVYLRAYLYVLLHGDYGLRRIAEAAIINANYLKKGLEPLFTIPFKRPCMHEFVVQADKYLPQGIRALDLAKRLLDYSIHAPTVYFPLTVKECLLIEPTESESKATLDRFLEVMEKIVEEIEEDPDCVRNAPHTLSVKRLDEVRAAKFPKLKA